MCEYNKLNKCLITNDICPYVFFCNKQNIWKPLKSMPTQCKIKNKLMIPKGYYKVRMERKGYLFIDIDNITIKVKNPFEDIPIFVKASKLKNGTWKLRK